MSIFQQLVDNPEQQQLPAQRDARLEVYRRIEALTGRPLVIYAADWLTPHKQQSQNFSAYVSLDYNDVLPFKELISPLEGPTLDVLIHSPGGLGEAAERLVRLLRGRFRDVRFIVPHSSMSAATMLCFSGNVIAMGEASALGPIDPQVGGVPARPSRRGSIESRKQLEKPQGHSVRICRCSRSTIFMCSRFATTPKSFLNSSHDNGSRNICLRAIDRG